MWQKHHGKNKGELWIGLSLVLFKYQNSQGQPIMFLIYKQSLKHSHETIQWSVGSMIHPNKGQKKIFFNCIWKGLERWFSSQEYKLFLQRTEVWFPAPTSSASQPTITIALEKFNSYSFCGHLHSCTHRHTDTCTYTPLIIINTFKSISWVADMTWLVQHLCNMHKVLHHPLAGNKPCVVVYTYLSTQEEVACCRPALFQSTTNQ